MKTLTIGVSIVFILGLMACGGERDTATTNGTSTELTDTVEVDPRSEEMMSRARDVFYAMPAPLELQSMLDDAGGYFREDLLLDPQKSTYYQTSEKQALALGVYGTDMSYTTVFDQQQASLLYLAAAQRVAKHLGVSDPFNGQVIERANNNINDKDSMVNIVSEIYWEMNSQLKEESRNQVGLIVIAASWIEGLFLGGQMMDPNNPEPEIVSVLMDQYFIASQFNEMFADYGDDPLVESVAPYFRPTIDKFLSLDVAQEAASVSEKEGKTVIGGATKVNYSPEDVADVIRLTKEARTNMVAL